MTKLIIEVLAAAIGSAAFSVLFQVRPKHYLFCGIAGGLGWLVYRVLTNISGSSVLATFAAALILTLCCRWFARLRKAPALIFLLCGIFPLVPGAAIYYAAYNLFLSKGVEAAYYAILTLKLGVAIALGIVIAYSLPPKLFGWTHNA